MENAKILQEAKAELERHIWGTFVEGKASVALGGTGKSSTLAATGAQGRLEL